MLNEEMGLVPAGVHQLGRGGLWVVGVSSSHRKARENEGFRG